MNSPPDTNLTSVSERPSNNTPTKKIIMPNFPKINLCQTNWQQEDANIISSKIVSASIPNDLLHEASDSENNSCKSSYLASTLGKSNDIEYFTWTPYLNLNLHIAIKGQTKDGFQHGRSIQKRISNLELIDKGNNIQKLRGTISHNGDLPAYVLEKFQNGFPNDWEMVTSVWVDYVRLKKPKDFRWPQPISDLNEDINDSHSDDLNSSTSSYESATIIQEEPIPQNMNNTFNVVRKSGQNQVKILSNILIQNSNIEEVPQMKRPNKLQNKENILCEINEQQNECLPDKVNDLIENAQVKNLINDTVSHIRKRNYSIANESQTQNSNKRRKISEAFDTIISTLMKLKDDINDIFDDNENETIKTKNDCKATQTETFVENPKEFNKENRKDIPEIQENRKEIPEIQENRKEIPETKITRPSSPEYMGIPDKKIFLVNSARSTYNIKRKICKKSRSENFNPTSAKFHKNRSIKSHYDTIDSKNVDSDASNQSFVSKGTYSIHESTPRKSQMTLEPTNGIVFDNKSSLENRNVNVKRFLEQRAKEKLIKTPMCTKISKLENTISIVDVPENTDNIVVAENNLDGSLHNDDEFSFPIPTARRQTIFNYDKSPNRTLKNDSKHCNNLNLKENDADIRVVLDPIDPSNTIQVSKRGRVRCAPLNYWEGETLENTVKTDSSFKIPTSNQVEKKTRPKKRVHKLSEKKNMSENILHPAFRDIENITFKHRKISVNGRVKLFDRTVEDKIDTVIENGFMSDHTQFTDF